MLTALLTRPIERGAPYENPKIPLSDPAVIAYLDGSASSSAGVPVSRQSSLGLSAFWRGVNLIAKTIGKVTTCVYRKLDNDAREEDDDHPAAQVLRFQSNLDTTPFVLKATLQAHALCHGNGYAYIVRDRNGDVTELLPLSPDCTLVERGRDKRLRYRTRMDNIDYVLAAEDVLHIRGLTHDGILGYSVIDTLREMLGLGIALQKYAAIFFRNNARPSGVIQLPAGIKLRDQAAVERLRESWGRVHEGIDNAHKPAILEDGATFHQMSISNEDAQFLESMKLNITQISNALGVPPHKLGDATRTSYASLEQENQAFLDDSIEPWFVTWEQECRTKLLREAEKETRSHYIEFSRNQLVRADFAQRITGYAAALQNGWMNRDEVRARENMNPLPDGEGQKFFIPLNMQLTGEDAEDEDNGDEMEPADMEEEAGAMGDEEGDPMRALRREADSLRIELETERRRMAESATRIAEDITRLCRSQVRKLGHHARNAAHKPKSFNTWLDDGFAPHVEAFTDLLSRAVATQSMLTRGSTCHDVARVVSAWVAGLRTELNDISGRVTADALPIAVDAVVLHHEERAAADIISQLTGVSHAIANR